MTRRLPLFAHGLNLAMFGALLGPQPRSERPRNRRPQKLRYQPRRHLRPPDDRAG